MPSSLSVGPLVAALQQRLFPTITHWNRLEARPRTPSFERALRAEIRDPLWMLTKQWQMGEFRGSDAGSPTFAKLQIALTRLTKYRPDAGSTQLFEEDVPLEAKVERRPIPLTVAGRPVAFDLRLALGREWLRLIAGIGPFRDAFVNAYPIAAPDPTKQEDADRCAHQEVWQFLAAVAGRAMDGGALLQLLAANPANHAYDGIAGIAAADHAAIDNAGVRFIAWFGRLLMQPPPSGDNAWAPTRLEYQFAASAPEPDGTEKVYVADEFYQDRLDWYSFDVDASIAALDPVPNSNVTGFPPQITRAMIPIPVSFAGMPNTRWWTFEDNRTNFGDIDAATTDLAKLLFMEFALVYSNDWLVIPFTLPSGAVATVDGLVVTNVFNERFWIVAAGSGADTDWQRWSMFTIDTRNKPGAVADTSLLLPPTLAKIQRSAPVEDVMMVRDEVANMVWGIETAIPLATGEPKRGIEAARQTRAFLEAQLAARLGGPPPPPPAKAPIRYTVMSTVPENWIPFIPVHVPGSNREIQVQRAALPRILEGDPDPPVKVQPRAVLMRDGLDAVPAQPYFVHEEEVSRAGARLFQAFERTRWTDGSVYTWLRVVRQTGRGEGSSGLAFDALLNVPVK
ncbi:hypothetical protein OKW30_007801 [Paraburkholderia sp. Clong3]|uniref:hypothetical protein n=1 Tax=Paraburkholderia sp. Clong3 TaxID=2991061 RepID=UPI003D1D5533